MVGSHYAYGYVQLWPQFICNFLGRNLKLCHKMGEAGDGGFHRFFFFHLVVMADMETRKVKRKRGSYDQHSVLWGRKSKVTNKQFLGVSV